MHSCGSGTRQTFGWTPDGAFCFLFSQCLWSVIYYIYMQTALYPLCHRKLFLLLGGENSQPQLVSHQYSGMQILIFWLRTQILPSWFALPQTQWTVRVLAEYNFFIQPTTDVGGGLCFVLVDKCVCLLALHFRVRNRFGWYVKDRAHSAKISWFTFG